MSKISINSSLYETTFHSHDSWELMVLRCQLVIDIVN